MRAQLTTILALMLGVVALAGGCGDGDDATTAGSSAGGDTTAGADSGGSGEGQGSDGGQSGDGQSSDGTSISTSSLSKTQFVKKASAACRQIRKDLVPEAAAYMGKKTKGGTPEPVALAEMSGDVLVPTIEAEIAAVRRIGAPAGDEEEVEAILVADQEAADELKELESVESFEAILEHFVDVNRELREYGFTACTN